ncbi:MAG TPA: hypothetical protein VE465_14845 [Streptosporangiaceae bacterium]|jgi:hypothetical protein|nr:hypothetical protein [Streptosporangiaceae bacterium]
MVSRRRTTRRGLSLLVTLALAAGAGCSSDGGRPPEPVATTAGGSPIDERLTPEIATRAFRSYVQNDDVARASGDERLALSWTDDGQAQLTAAEFRKAAFTGDPVPRYAYSRRRFYVPRLTHYPKWFVVAADRMAAPTPGGPGGSAGRDGKQAVLMAFVRKSADSRWRLSLATVLEPKGRQPQITVGDDGYATPLATFDIGLVIQPRIVPAMQATLAEEGPESLATKVMLTGPHTSGYYLRDQHNEARNKERGLAYDSVYAATGFPIYSLRTADGGGLVLYALSRNTVTFVKDKRHGRLSVPRDAAHLLDTIVLKDELDVTETLQFAAAVPAKPPSTKNKTPAPGKAPAKASVIASDGAVISAETSEAD